MSKHNVKYNVKLIQKTCKKFFQILIFMRDFKKKREIAMKKLSKTYYWSNNILEKMIYYYNYILLIIKLPMVEEVNKLM